MHQHNGCTIEGLEYRRIQAILGYCYILDAFISLNVYGGLRLSNIILPIVLN